MERVFSSLRAFAMALPVLLVGACATTFEVSSDPPGADVYLSQSPTLRSGKSLGQTPVEVSLADAPLERGGYLSVEKPGYVTETLFVSEPVMGMTGAEIHVRLVEGARDGQKASTLLGLLASAQEQAQMGKLDLAHATIERSLSIDPYFVRGLSFKGALFFMEKKYDESEEAYKRALGLEPNFAEATRMLTKIDLARKGGKP